MQTLLGVGAAGAATVLILGSAAVVGHEGRSTVRLDVPAASTSPPGEAQLVAAIQSLTATEGRLSGSKDSSAMAAVKSELAGLDQQMAKFGASGTSPLVPYQSGTSVAMPSVTVTGVGTINSNPDVLSVDVGVSVNRNSIAGALSVADKESAAVVSALESHGVAPAAIQTQLVSLGQCYNSCSGGAYTAANQVSADIHDVSQAGTTIGAAVQAGGNDATLGGVYFNLEQNTRQIAQARAAAMSDALNQASDFARLAGRRLGPARTVLEVQSATPPNGASGPSAGASTLGGVASPSIPIQAGQQQVSVVVTVTYDLE